MIYKPVYSFKIYKNADATPIVVLPKYVASVNFSQSTQFQKQAEFMTGLSEVSGAVLEIIKPAAGKDADLTAFLDKSFDWRMSRIEVYTSNGGNLAEVTLRYAGLLFVRKESNNTVTFTSRNFLDLLNITLIETPLFRSRKTATRVPDTVTVDNLKKQDPTIKEGSSVGIINTLLWLAGGRPYKYKSLYTTQNAYVLGQHPKFYFDCENSVINPEWVWFNYENLTGDLAQLCKASGGLLTQDNDGVVRYKSLYSMREAWNNVTLTDSKYQSIDIGESSTEPYAKIVTTFTPRYLSNSQEVYSAAMGEYLSTGQSFTRQIEFSKPTYKIMNRSISGQLSDSIVGTTLKYIKDKITAVDTFGTRRQVKIKISNYDTLYIPKYVATDVAGTFTITKDEAVVASQSAMLTISHTAEPAAGTIYIGEVFIYGRPLEAASQETYIKRINQYPSIAGYKELRLPDNPYIQAEAHAKRIVDVASYLMANPREQLSVKGVAVVSGIELGRTIRLTSSVYSLDDYYSVTAINYINDMAAADLTLLSMSGLYSLNDLFIVGSTYSDTDSKRLSF